MSPAARSQLVTGATGFVGAALTLELLRRTTDKIYCLVRARDGRDAEQRLADALSLAAMLYGVQLTSAEAARCYAVHGDIAHAGCEINAGELPSKISEVWHCAASLKYAEHHRAEIEAHNLTGTTNILAVAEALDVNYVNYMSTAYVAGTRTGIVREEPIGEDCATNNVYEESKIRAEAMLCRRAKCNIRILRPSIVIAHSATQRGATKTGIYSFIEEMRRFQRSVAEQLGDYLKIRSIAVMGSPDVRLNMIPVDVVADCAVTLSIVEAPSGFYHLASLDPPTLGDCLDVLTRAVEMRAARFVQDPRQLNSIDEKFNEGIEFHRSYLLQNKLFDCSKTVAVCGEQSLRTELDLATMTLHARTYLDDQDRYGESPLAVPTEGGT